MLPQFESVMPKQRIFELTSVTLAAQEWGEVGQTPVLALHGWLDNSASFSELAPKLKNVHLVALDLAGHGQSGHRPPGVAYNIWDDVAEVFAVADQLGWEKFTLLGHSRGAIISTVAAGTFPERIVSLNLVDGLLPMLVKESDAPAQLAQSIMEVKDKSAKQLRVFSDIDTAVKARLGGHFKLSLKAATALSERGIKAVPEGFSWSSDSRLMAASAFKLTAGHAKAFVSKITAPALLVLAMDSDSKIHPYMGEVLKIYPDVVVEEMPGTHHLHLEVEAKQVAEVLNRHIALHQTVA